MSWCALLGLSILHNTVVSIPASNIIAPNTLWIVVSKSFKPLTRAKDIVTLALMFQNVQRLISTQILPDLSRNRLLLMLTKVELIAVNACAPYLDENVMIALVECDLRCIFRKTQCTR